MVHESDDAGDLEGDDLFYDQDGPGLFGDDEPLPTDELAVPDSLDDADDDEPTVSDALLSAEDDLLEPLTSQRPSASGDDPSDPQEPMTVTDTAEAPLALYRRYRPETFAEVIGQEHVTAPLQRALTNNKVNHAYLFSGPRGCGKTSSARILARALNCEQGPTPTPCGQCRSCRDLARGGPGSIDVIEIDAASHGGVDDARDLRERAFFAPVSSRYKVYIVDEAHMVTTAGFNAMLKLVEEPPPHVKFIFATTEPDKVIGTIRSRTHHYPFRLVPPKVLTSYLAQLCEAEQVSVDPTVLPLVVRAGAGSVRDSLSVLDQLLGGADAEGVGYQQAASLLGYTPDTLLDEIVDAFAAGDARAVFASVDKVIEVGQDPRRFAEDLLRRLRDLVIVAAVPDAAHSGLIDVADDQAERFAAQASALGAGELTRAAEVIATGLTDMRGTTAPRLHLELMCARVLLPGADVNERGLHARLDRVERRIGASGVPVSRDAETPLTQDSGQDASREEPSSSVAHRSASPEPRGEASPPAAQPAEPVTETPAPEPARTLPEPTPDHVSEATTPAPRKRSGRRPAGAAPNSPAGAAPNSPAGAAPNSPAGASSAASASLAGAERATEAPPSSASQAAGDPGAIDVTRLRREWPQVLDEVRRRRRFSWMLLSQNAQVSEVVDGVVTLAFSTAGARDNFNSGGTADVLGDSLVEVLGANLRVVPVLADDPSGLSNPPQAGASSAAGSTSPDTVRPDPVPPPAEPRVDEERAVIADSEDVEDSGRSAADLVVEQLGATVIDEPTAG